MKRKQPEENKEAEKRVVKPRTSPSDSPSDKQVPQRGHPAHPDRERLPFSVGIWSDYLIYTAYKWILGPTKVDARLTAELHMPNVTEARREAIASMHNARDAMSSALGSILSKLAPVSELFAYAACSIDIQEKKSPSSSKRSSNAVIYFVPNPEAFFWRDLVRVPRDDWDRMNPVAGHDFVSTCKRLADNPPLFSRREFTVSRELLAKLQACMLFALFHELVDLLVMRWLQQHPMSDPLFMDKLDTLHMDYPFTDVHHVFIKGASYLDLPATAATA